MRVEADGAVPCELALFGEMPGWEEQQEGRPFVGKAGRQLWSDMKRFVGLTRDDFYVSNVIKIGLPKGRDPKPDDVSAALPEFLDELEAVKPRVVVTAGSFATRAMLGDVKLADVHGIPHTAEVAGQLYICHPIYHPGAGLNNKGFLAAFAYDLKALAAVLRGDLQPWAATESPAVCSWLEPAAIAELSRLKAGYVTAVDTEGWPDCPWGLSFSVDGLHGYVIKATDNRSLAWFSQWITGKLVVMHNGIHDLPVLRAMGVSVNGYHDTQVLGYHDIIRTGSGVLESESQNLGTLAYRGAQMPLGELTTIPGVDFDTQTIPYSDAVMEYAGADPCATWRLFCVYRDRGLTDSPPYQIDMGQVGLVERMIETGIPFEYDDAVSYYADVLDKLDACTTDLRAMAARLGNRDFNPGSHPQVRELLIKKIGLRIRNRTKGGLASTNEKALAIHRDHPFVARLQDYRELAKLKGTYIGPLLEELS